MAKVYGKVAVGWSSLVVLPIAQAAQLVELISLGLHRENGSWPDKGLVRLHANGKHLEPPHMEVLTEAQYNELIRAGQDLLGHELTEHQAKEEARRQAEAEAKRELVAAAAASGSEAARTN